MIKETELRVGNWVVDTKTDKPAIVDVIHVNGKIYTEDETFDDFRREIEPASVPISEPILRNFGFNYYAWEDFLQFVHMIKGSIILRLTGDGVSVFNFSKCDESEKQHITTLKAVHELQNLYFAITKEELEVIDITPEA